MWASSLEVCQETEEERPGEGRGGSRLPPSIRHRKRCAKAGADSGRLQEEAKEEQLQEVHEERQEEIGSGGD
eukprot:CAMPEP_0194329026 /NCGR_PEP_ID=MMETSP0171-20130528/46750_1 /TAXON_ID=218684 /ORGANISM="Corethron pennatum, Strain L29A3" /LENGTH=71 /DNA_ID=CAMNT_0039089601 /DNA_START=221 /DNA_END=436 /DNA_ORIENTATION=-